MRPWIRRLLSWFRVGGGAQASAYSGAAHNRLTLDWIRAPIRSADDEIRGDLSALRGRAREMVRNNSYASRFVDLAAENVVGHKGIQLQSRVLLPNGEFDRATNDRIEAAWKEWGNPENASADGRMSWTDIEHMALRSLTQDGEILIRILPGYGNRFGFAVQVLDPDQLDHEFNRPAGNGANEIRMGVEINEWGKPVRYHLWSKHPADFSQRDRKRIAVPADQIIHAYVLKRPGQTRGVTWFAPVLLDAKMLAGYQEAELVAARTAAAKMGWWVPREGEAGIGEGDPISMEASPGTFEFGPAGHDFAPFDPQHPTSAFRDFNKAILRSIATGLGVSYATIANDLESVNYSSIRAGLLSERDFWKRLQVWLYTHLHRRVYLEWMKWALTTGALRLPSRNTERWKDHIWLPRGWPWVDPLKDVQAGLLAVRGGLDSRTRLAGEQGRDFEEILADLDREQQLAAEYEVELSADPRRPGGARASAKAPEWLNRIDTHLNGNGNGRHALNGKGS